MREQTYNEFIQNILNTRGRFGIPKGEYKERHHIIPRCVGGTDDEDNLIDLYAREHFIAHKLLAEENRDNHKLVAAYSFLAFNLNKYYEISPEEYEYEKIKVAKMLSIHMKENNPAKREDVKLKLSKNHADVSGANNPMYGSHRAGKDNPMCGKGYKLTRGKNGRALKIICLENNLIFNCGLDVIDWLHSEGAQIDISKIISYRNKLLKAMRKNTKFYNYTFKVIKDI